MSQINCPKRRGDKKDRKIQFSSKMMPSNIASLYKDKYSERLAIGIFLVVLNFGAHKKLQIKELSLLEIETLYSLVLSTDSRFITSLMRHDVLL